MEDGEFRVEVSNHGVISAPVPPGRSCVVVSKVPKSSPERVTDDAPVAGAFPPCPRRKACVLERNVPLLGIETNMATVFSVKVFYDQNLKPPPPPRWLQLNLISHHIGVARTLPPPLNDWCSFHPNVRARSRLESVATDKICTNIVEMDGFPKSSVAAKWSGRTHLIITANRLLDRRIETFVTASDPLSLAILHPKSDQT